MTQKITVLGNDSEMMDRDPPRQALTRLEHVREELARVYRSARTGKLETQDATRLTYILVNLSKIIESSDLEQRVKALEEAKEK